MYLVRRLVVIPSSMFFAAGTALFVLGAGAVTVGLASPLTRRAVPYYPPADGGGSMLDSSAGLGEPLNVCLTDDVVSPLLRNIFLSLGIGTWTGHRLRLEFFSRAYGCWFPQLGEIHRVVRLASLLPPHRTADL